MGILASTREKLNRIKPSIVFLLLSLLVGGYIRLSRVLTADFPLNDGGLFFQMTTELIANHFKLPLFTTYNHLGIPFAYPPLAFYLTGGLSQLFGWSLLDVYRVFPAVISILTIPAFYLLAREITQDDNHLAIATLIFSVLPPTFHWVIMGGGVTRSLAFFFSLFALFFTIRLFKRQNYKYLFAAGLFLSLSILAHPETGFHTALTVPVFWFFLSKNKHGVLLTFLMAVLTITLTAPWWGTVLVNHGFDPFKAALVTSEQTDFSLYILLNFDLTEEVGIASIAVLALLGMLLYSGKKSYFLPVWLLVSYVISPRSARLTIAPVIAILASYTLILITQWLDERRAERKGTGESGYFIHSIPSKLLLFVLFFQWFTSALLVIRDNTYIRMTGEDRQVMEWIKENSDTESRFLIITDHFWAQDPVSEWFPTLTGRISIATVQGTEWLPEGRYTQAVIEARKLQHCVDQTPTCVQVWVAETGRDFDYLYIRKLKIQTSPHELIPYDSALAELLREDADYQLVYDGEAAVIFKRK
jgi:asparagine N-glycosylation enzyme membrane subunit Stt3